MLHFNTVIERRHIKSACLFLVLTAFLPLIISCQSKGYRSKSSQDPYAENIPKTKEEEEYYNDVLSGDWKSDMSSTLGHFGLGKFQASTTPPAHWSMTPPKGSKTMEEIRSSYYEKQVAERGSSSSLNKQDAVPYKTASTLQPQSDYQNDSHSVKDKKKVEDEEESDESEETKEENKHSFLKGWSFFTPKDKPRTLAADDSFFPQPGLSDNAVLRGQAPDAESTTDRGIISTADAQKVPLKIDPDSAEGWKYADGRGMVRNNIPKDLPSDEYILIGGDMGGEAFALPNWDVHNLESDETIAHFDTLSGQIKVEPSNQLILYAPRFGTVRQTVGPKSESQNTRLTSMGTDTSPTETQSETAIDIRSQEEKASYTRGNLQASDMRAGQPGGVISGEEGLIEETGKILTASTGGTIQGETLSDAAKLALTEGTAAAAAWGKTQGTAVQIDRLSAQGNITLQGAATIYSIKNDTKTSQLRLFKSASKEDAAPGEVVEFTLRYENVGTETIGNVTVLDSLSSRLEYIEESAISSKNADFLIKNNETGSLILRWEITDPLEPGDFGVLIFLCRVR